MPCAMTWSCVWSGERMMSCSCRMSGRCMIMACVMGVWGFGEFGIVVVPLFQLYKYLFVITCSCRILSNFWSIVLSFLSIVSKSIMRRMNIMMNNITAVNVPFNESSIVFIIL